MHACEWGRSKASIYSWLHDCDHRNNDYSLKIIVITCYTGFFEGSIWSASSPSPTVRALRHLARLLQDGRSSNDFNHSCRTALKQSLTTWWLVCWMSFNVPAVSPSSSPRLYQSARPSHIAFWTNPRSFSVRSDSWSWSDKIFSSYCVCVTERE